MQRVEAIAPRWLTVKDAAMYAALGVKRLKKLAQNGEVLGFPDPTSKRGDWIFDRISLDDYRKAQAGQNEIWAAVADVTERMTR